MTRVMESSPTQNRIFSLTLVFMLAALGVSLYLAYTESFATQVACPDNPVFDCGTVQASKYGKLGGIHIAYLGTAFNLAIVGLLVFGHRIPPLADNLPVLVTGFLFFGVLYSIWLIWVQAGILSAFCIWCLVHEIAIFGAFGTSIPALRRHLVGEGVNAA